MRQKAAGGRSLACRFFGGALYRRARPGQTPSSGRPSREMPRQLAASSTDKPAKNRSSTRRSLTGSSTSSWASASFKASRSSDGAAAGASTASSGSRRRPPPCFNRFLRWRGVLRRGCAAWLRPRRRRNGRGSPNRARPHRPDAGMLRRPRGGTECLARLLLRPVSARPGGAGPHRPTAEAGWRPPHRRARWPIECTDFTHDGPASRDDLLPKHNPCVLLLLPSGSQAPAGHRDRSARPSRRLQMRKSPGKRSFRGEVTSLPCPTRTGSSTQPEFFHNRRVSAPGT